MGKTSGARHRIMAPVIGGKWVYMVALAVQSIGKIKLLEAAVKKS
jgi:hypothetical protein